MPRQRKTRKPEAGETEGQLIYDLDNRQTPVTLDSLI